MALSSSSHYVLLICFFRGKEITILLVDYLRVMLASQTKEILVFILVPYVRSITEVVAEHFDHKKKKKTFPMNALFSLFS